MLGGLVEKQVQTRPAARAELEAQFLFEVVSRKITRPAPWSGPAMDDQVQAMLVVTTLPIQDRLRGREHGGFGRTLGQPQRKDKREPSQFGPYAGSTRLSLHLAGCTGNI